MSNDDGENVLGGILKLFSKPRIVTLGSATILLGCLFGPKTVAGQLVEWGLLKPLFGLSVFGVFSWPVRVFTDSDWLLQYKVNRIKKLFAKGLITEPQRDFHVRHLVDKQVLKIKSDSNFDGAFGDGRREEEAFKRKIQDAVIEIEPTTPNFESDPQGPHFGSNGSESVTEVDLSNENENE